MWSLLPLIVSCTDKPKESAVDIWRRSQEEALAHLNLLPREQQEIEILHLIETYPQSTLNLCDLLKRGSAKKRCLLLKSRPHLWTSTPSKQAVHRKSSGPVGRHLHPKYTDSSLAHHVGELPVCTEEITLLSCVEKQTQEIKNPTIVAAMCNALTLGWREECYFTTAESLVRADGVASYENAVRYCLHSGAFQSNCFQHVIFQLAEQSIADPNEEESWQTALSIETSLDLFWKNRDDHFGRAMVDLFWAKQTDLSVLTSGALCLTPLNHLPQTATNHYRDAYVYYALQNSSRAQPLQDWVTELKQRDCSTDKQFPFRRKKHQDNWSNDTNGTDTFPAQYYLTDGRRAVGTDVNEDWELSILEAAARLPMAHSVLEQPVVSSYRSVQWTYNRLYGK